MNYTTESFMNLKQSTEALKVHYWGQEFNKSQNIKEKLAEDFLNELQVEEDR